MQPNQLLFQITILGYFEDGDRNGIAIDDVTIKTSPCHTDEPTTPLPSKITSMSSSETQTEKFSLNYSTQSDQIPNRTMNSSTKSTLRTTYNLPFSIESNSSVTSHTTNLYQKPPNSTVTSNSVLDILFSTTGSTTDDSSGTSFKSAYDLSGKVNPSDKLSGPKYTAYRNGLDEPLIHITTVIGTVIQSASPHEELDVGLPATVSPCLKGKLIHTCRALFFKQSYNRSQLHSSQTV